MKSRAGYVKIFRKIQGWEWYKKGDTIRVFLHLIMQANFEATTWRGLPLQAGQLVIGRTEIAAELNISEQSVRTILKRLQSTNEITVKSTGHGTVVTLVKWAEYAGISEKSTNESPLDQPLGRIRESKKKKHLSHPEERDAFLSHPEFVAAGGEAVDLHKGEPTAPTAPALPLPVRIMFEDFWDLYPARRGKKHFKDKAFDLYSKLTPADHVLCNQAAANYAGSEAVKAGIGIKDAIRFIRSDEGYEFWRDWIEPETPPVRGTLTPIDQAMRGRIARYFAGVCSDLGLDPDPITESEMVSALNLEKKIGIERLGQQIWWYLDTKKPEARACLGWAVNRISQQKFNAAWEKNAYRFDREAEGYPTTAWWR
jgi:hypothetical protein